MGVVGWVFAWVKSLGPLKKQALGSLPKHSEFLFGGGSLGRWRTQALDSVTACIPTSRCVPRVRDCYSKSFGGAACGAPEDV